MRLVGMLGAIPLAACLQVSTGSEGSGGGATATTGAGEDSGSNGPVGIGCMTSSGIELCQEISTCPGVVVDLGALPSCGFRLGGAASIDLECDCSGSLCPIGAPQTCADAAQLLQGQDALQICEQASEGLCLGVAPDAGSASGASSGCNPQCQSECAGNPDCYQACGC